MSENLLGWTYWFEDSIQVEELKNLLKKFGIKKEYIDDLNNKVVTNKLRESGLRIKFVDEPTDTIMIVFAELNPESRLNVKNLYDICKKFNADPIIVKNINKSPE